MSTHSHLLPSRAIIAMVMMLFIINFPSSGAAWDTDASCASGNYEHWNETLPPKIEIRWATSGATPNTWVQWSEDEKTIIRKAISTYNHIPNARIYFTESSVGCVGEQYEVTKTPQQNNTVCIMKKVTTGSTAGQAKHSSTVGDECRINWCEVELKGPNLATDEGLLWQLTLHEVGHCLGLAGGLANSNDWMQSVLEEPMGGTSRHVGMTRDTMNALSYRYPFGNNFFAYDAGIWGKGILTRDATSQSNTIPWYLSTFSLSFYPLSFSFTNRGEVSDDGDFGNENTLNYLVGDFKGDGAPLDVAAGLCGSCNTSDGYGDTVVWYVMEGG